MRLLGVWVLSILEHEALGGHLSFRAVLKKHWLLLTSRDHEVFLRLITLFCQIFLDSLASHLFLYIGDLAEVSTPCGQTEADDQIEQDDIDYEPPVESGDLGAACIVNATPELELNKEHAAADEEVEAK